MTELKESRLERVVRVLNDILMPEIEILNVHRLRDELGADSLDYVELIMAVEEEFDIEDPMILTEEQHETWTVQDIVDNLETLLGPEFPPEGPSQILQLTEDQFINRYHPEQDE